MRVSNESVPYLTGPLSRHVQGSLLQQKGYELEVCVHTFTVRVSSISDDVSS